MSHPDHQLSGPEPAPRPTPFLEATVLGSLAAAIGSLLLFAWTADKMREGNIWRMDEGIRGWVHQFASPALTRIMEGCSFVGYQVLIASLVVSLAIFFKLRWRRAATWLIITMAGALVLDLVLKYSFHRPRPTPWFVAQPETWSFPSGHSLFSFCFYGVMAGLIMDRTKSRLLRVAIWCAAVLVVAAIGLSRIYLGVHYPSDVLAGYLAAAVWVTGMVAADRVWFRKRK